MNVRGLALGTETKRREPSSRRYGSINRRRCSVYLGFPVRIFLGVVAHPSRRKLDFKVPLYERLESCTLYAAVMGSRI